MKKITKNKARISILTKLLSCPTITYKEWNATFFDVTVKEGDLVSMNFASASKWYLSWVREIETLRYGGKKYLLESVDDQSLCWWSNISLNIYNRDEISPMWHWDDNQYAFNRRWKKVCFNWNDAYIVLPVHCTFFDSHSVEISVKIRHNLSEFKNSIKFDNYKKVTMKMMDKFYKECEVKYNESK